MEIKQSEAHTKIHQQQYIQNVIKQLRIPINTRISTPMATTFVKLIKQSAHNNHHVSKRLLKLYLMYIGIIRYLADSTRPDVAYTAHKLATHCTNPTQQHVDAAIRTLQYLFNTSHYGISYPKRSTHNNDKLILYTDSSMADLPGAKTTIGYYTLYNNAVVDWKAKQTNNVAIQQNEAEFIAAMA
eukprot:Pgem_evm1s19108